MSPDDNMILGLASNTKEKPEFEEMDPGVPAIARLQPGTMHHQYVLEYLLERIDASEREMSKFYSRWQVAERKMQAYMSLPNYEQMLKDMNDSSQPPAPAIILLPYNYAVISTIVTYCMKVFCGKKPFFPLGADSKEAADNVRYMEAMVQHHCDKTRMVLRLFQMMLDSQLYGVGAARCIWHVKQGKRRVLRPPTDAERLSYAGNPEALGALLKDYQIKTVFAGNDVSSIDPFMLFPDPTVPMSEASQKAEFIFWREFLGKHHLIRAQKEGLLHYVDTVQPEAYGHGNTKWYNLSQRSALAGGKPHAGERVRSAETAYSNTYMVDQGSVEIIPNELGLGPEDYPVKWLFTILNKSQIVQAVELDMDHGRHPIEITEPYSLGYGFGQPSLSDYISPIQDISSWFLDTHIYNVRTHLANQLVYDPSKIDEKSLKDRKPGKHIRLKPLAFGSDVRQAIQQLQVSDVTRAHLNDMTAFMRIGDMVSAVNDPMRGVQQMGGRRTASEVRQVGENAFSRLSVLAQIISQQAVVQLTEQMVMNIQQMQDEETWIRLIGEEEFRQVGPQLLMGDFTYPVHDGTLPLDRVASFDLWKEILTGMAQSPVLSQTHSLPRIFEHVSTLGGAANIASFRLVPDSEMDKIAQAGNAIPVNQLPTGIPPNVA